MTMVMTVLRGLRSRTLLSGGSVLLISLAIGSAVLGPIYSVAVTDSYLVSRLTESPNALTGLSWRFVPDTASSDGENEEGQSPTDRVTADAIAAAEGQAPDLFAAPQVMLETDRVQVYGGLTKLATKPGACEHLEIEGSCPTRPGEVILLEGDLEMTGSEVGQRIDLGELGEVEIVGTYLAPGPEEADFWFDQTRFESIPPISRRGLTTPYLPAPWMTAPETLDRLPQSAWAALVDRQLLECPDLTLADIDEAVEVAKAQTGPAVSVPGGQLVPVSINDVDAVAREARVQQATARNSIAPAVLSLVLVAMALLLRLLTAAADLRLPELALASLRGLSRRRMWQLGLSEPLALLLISVPIGAAVGLAMAWGLVNAWLVPGLPLPLPAAAVLSGALVVVSTALVAILAVGLVLRVSLSDQLTGVRRPQRSGRLATVLQLVLAATALTVLASKLSASAPGDPDVTDLVLPVLLAIVAGLAAARLTSWGAGWWTRRRRGDSSLPGFVAARAISRRHEGTLVVLPVTAAIAICVFGAGVYDSAAAWRTSVAATVAPADVVWQSPLPLPATVDLTHEIDPDGEYLMAASTLVTQGPAYTIADTERLARVAAWQSQWTPGVEPQQIADDLALTGVVPVLNGEVVGITVDRDTTAGDPLTVQLRLDSPDGDVHHAFLGPFGQGEGSAEVETPYCRNGCQLEAITLGGPAASPLTIAGDVRLSGITADGEPVPGAIEGAGWTVAPNASAGDAITGVSAEGEELLVSIDSPDEPVIAQLVAGSVPLALPVVKGVDARTRTEGGAQASSGTDFPVDPVVEARSVPLLGPVGLLVDFTTLTTDRDLLEQEVPVLVLARADTPLEMQRALQRQGATVLTTLDAEQRTLNQSAYALALRLYAVVALLVLLMALAGLLVSTAVQLPARRRDAASLRVVGVPRRSVMSSVMWELTFVLGGTAVAGLAAGALAQYIVLRTVTLGYVEKLTTPALVAAIDPARLLVAGLLALVFGGIALAKPALSVRGARGATLRESAR